MFCRQCGANIGDGARFCPSCGASQDDVPAPVQVQKSERWESTSLKIHPDEEQATIDNYEAFGWEFVSSQTIDTADSHLEREFGGFGDLVSITETTNYVKLAFRRNKNIAHYDEITKLEDEYFTLYKRYKSKSWVPSGGPKKPKKPVDYNTEFLPESVVNIAYALNPLAKFTNKKHMEKKNKDYEKDYAVWKEWKTEKYDPAERAITNRLDELKRKADELLSVN
ncbi:MAG: zinc ribbon domain-containing protein [Ruminococcaceae bacterium]|nr:zinc ribbon domain-containing protein [Oscillospiraceae bacterium]